VLVNLLSLGVGIAYIVISAIGILRKHHRVAMFEIAAILAAFAVLGYSIIGMFTIAGTYLFCVFTSIVGLMLARKAAK
jgi:hypothetical protein